MDGGPTLDQHGLNVSCLLGGHCWIFTGISYLESPDLFSLSVYGSWHRIYSAPPNARTKGGLNDGPTLETVAVNVLFQACTLNYMGANGNHLYFPLGKIGRQLQVVQNLLLWARSFQTPFTHKTCYLIC